MTEQTPANRDFADVESDSAIRLAVDNARLVNAGDGWPMPRKIANGLPDVEPFSPLMLPEPLRDWAQDIAKRMQVPIDYVAVTAMISAGAVIGRKVGVRPQLNTDWQEAANLWGCVIGRPGLMKSPAIKQAMAPINRLQVQSRETYSFEKEDYEGSAVERELRAAAVKDQMKRRLKASANADCSDLKPDDPDEPILRRYVVNDGTYQALAELLRQNPNGLLVHRDELVALLNGLDGEQNSDARGFYLSSWNGYDDYTVDRVGRGFNLYIPSITLSMIGSTQPGKIKKHITAALGGGSGDDGLLQRFGLMVWPDVSSKWVEHDQPLDGPARQQAMSAFSRLDSLTPESVGARQDPFEEGKAFLRFDGDGIKRFKAWHALLEARVRGGELHPAMESHLSKYRGLVPSIALVHHLTNDGHGPIPLTSVIAAIMWANYLESHANRVYGAALNAAAEGARLISSRIASNALGDAFTAREVHRKNWAGLSDIDVVTEAIEILEEHDWLRINEPEHGKPGRPSKSCTVNPRAIRHE